MDKSGKIKIQQDQIVGILKSFDQGKNVEEITCECGISRQTFYQWRKKYVGLEMKELKRIKEVEAENARLKKIYANLALDLDIAKYVVKKIFKALPKTKHERRTSNPKEIRQKQGLSNIRNEH